MDDSTNQARFKKYMYRIGSFRALPNTRLKPVTLARNGFYYCTDRSLVLCFRCGAIIDEDTDPEDHPEYIHNPGCRYEDTVESDSVRPGSVKTSEELLRNLKGSASTNQQEAPPLDGATASPVPQPASDPRSSPDSDFFLGMHEERSRRETFHDFESSVVDKKQLAEAGFFYTGVGDRVQCAFCKGVLCNWDTGDNPMKQHHDHFKQCPYVQGKNVNNVPIPKSTSKSTSPSHNVTCGPAPKNPQYADPAKRLESYKNWPRNKKPVPRTLMEAGFFFSGQGDQVKCYFCDGGLRNWEPDEDPKKLHDRWFPKCPLVSQSLRQTSPEDGATGGQSDSRETLTADASGRYTVNKSVIDACMARPVVKKILGMGFTRDEVYAAYTQQLSTTGEDFAADSDLVDAVLSLRDHELHDALERSKQSAVPPHNAQSAPSKSKKKKKRVKKRNAEREASPVSERAPTPPPSEPHPKSDQTPVNLESDRVTQLMRENAEMREARQCKVCMDNDIGIVFLPCGHLVCCTECAMLVRDCPVCRALIKGTVRVFPS